MPEPTREDANLYLKLLAISQGGAHAEARRWVFSDFTAVSFDELNSRHPPGSVERDHLVNVMRFFESAAVLVSRGLLHEDVFFDEPFGFDVIWPRLKPIVGSWQKSAGDPAVWENVQWLGMRMEAWREQRWQPKRELSPPDRQPDRSEPAIRGFQH
jgi:hypothetical protein